MQTKISNFCVDKNHQIWRFLDQSSDMTFTGPATGYERDDPMSPVMTAFSSLPPLPSACVCPTTPRALFLPTSHPRYGRQGPIERLQAPSGEFPLFGPLFANNPLPSPRASPLALVNTHQGKTRVLFPPRATLAAST